MLNQNGRPNYGPRDWLMGSLEEGWRERRKKKKKRLDLASQIPSPRVCLFGEGLVVGGRGRVRARE